MPNSPHTNYRGTILKVAVPSPLRRTFDYLPPHDCDPRQLQTGVRVVVPFGKQSLTGIVMALATESELAEARLKPASAILDESALYSTAMQRVLQWASGYYQHPVGEVYATALPAKLRAGKPLFSPAKTSWQPVAALAELNLATLARAPRQMRLLQFIAGQGMASTDACQRNGYNTQLLRELCRKQLIKEVSDSRSHTPFDPDTAVNSTTVNLNAQQAAAHASIQAKLGQYACFLLDGITGSGKTEVYMRAMEAQLAAGKQCLILVPEIGLTPQTIMRFEQRFSCPVVALHSGLNDTQRLEAWHMAYTGEAGIIIGTRSAVFTPMANPGLIIVDEEHDSSFKQQDGFRYSARDLAVMRAREENVCVVLGSATPSLESLHNARSQKFIHLQLPNRAGKAITAAIEVVDIANETLDEGFSELLLFKIEKHLKNNNQVLVFINRRGFAPVLNCLSCGWIAECDNCVAQLTVHSKPPGLRCHHCGATHRIPSACPGCQSKNLSTYGMGTQKIEAFLTRRFAGTPVIRIDRDSARSRIKLEAMLSEVHKGEPCIALGTQMLAKGHHFPKITLAAILDADTGLFSADFRGQEHMAQTIVQVAGRAGRAEDPGEVLIQSRHAGHSLLQRLATGDYTAFTNALLQERRQSDMPPFSHLSLLRAEAPDLRESLNYLQRVKTQADALVSARRLPVQLLGPLPAPMEKRAGRFRAQLLLQSSHRGALQDLLSELCQFMEAGKQPARLRWSVDVDPQDLI